ncbi:Vitronectin [Galemys pyrenaicus]|uniref:Vitronectin n=1 Tax=Galemys pyrenaicus TaxID=202257 RepID=A0A8J6DTD1_GALPY|nr:Vitronectin [Galemys pyrenaicus]
MTPSRPLLMLASLAWVVLADQESCKGRCAEGFNAEKKCQCDELCSYYQSCCADYNVECKRQVTRGDVFTLPEDEYGGFDYPDTKDNASIVKPLDTPASGFNSQAPGPEQGFPVLETRTLAPEQGALGLETTEQSIFDFPAEEELCSGKPFDAFTDLKNGSLFAFRGKYCYELDEKAVRPGYPKLIKDVWGIEGPIDAAFTRINCQGKTYLFKGSQYWRFEDGVLDPDYPRNISDGFSGIPDNVDAALALPAHSYSGQERAYFFKGTRALGGGKKYWEYKFQQQPSQEECDSSSLSAVFAHFAQMQRDSWESIFELLFWGRSSGGAGEPQFISRDWHGVPGQVDAAMAGHMYISGSAPRSSWTKKPKSKRLQRKRYRSRGARSRSRSQKHKRPSRSVWLSWFSSEESDFGTFNYDYDMDWLVPATCEPIQSIYFFSGDKYYRVNLRTRRVDTVTPPYPRSIAQYWLGCPAPGHVKTQVTFRRGQLLELEQMFAAWSYPDIGTCEHLAQVICLPEAKIQVWFHNRWVKRIKNRKPGGLSPRPEPLQGSCPLPATLQPSWEPWTVGQSPPSHSPVKSSSESPNILASFKIGSRSGTKAAAPRGLAGALGLYLSSGRATPQTLLGSLSDLFCVSHCHQL